MKRLCISLEYHISTVKLIPSLYLLNLWAFSCIFCLTISLMIMMLSLFIFSSFSKFYMLFPWHLFPFIIQSKSIILACALFLFIFSPSTWDSFDYGDFFSSWFSYHQHNFAIPFAVAYSASLHFAKSGHISQIFDPIARFPNSIWAFAFLFMFILFKGSLYFIFVSCTTPNSFSILCLMLLISSFHNSCSKPSSSP